MFDFNPFEVGNFSTLGCLENDQELKVNQLVSDYIDVFPSENTILRELRVRGIYYDSLPQYLVDRIDAIPTR